MSLPLNIIDLAITEDISDDSAEVARRLDKAADLVESFAEQSGIDALDSFLVMADKLDAEGATVAVVEEALRIAQEVNDQSSILHCEVERFTSVSSKD